MYGNNNSSSSNNNSGYSPYGYPGKSSGGRLFGMSHSLPSGMSRYAFSPQDTEFTSYPSSSSRRVYNDYSVGGGGGGNSLGGSVCNVPPTASNNSLNCIGGGGSGGSGSGGSASGDDHHHHHHHSHSHHDSSGTNLIVNYLPQDMTDRELYALFRTIGPINTCRIMRDFKVGTGYSFGYAFVDFTSETDSQRAIKSLNGITVRNKRLKVSYARPGGESIKDTNLYVTNLPRTITEDQLDTIFGKYGSIVQKNILRDKLTGKPRGVAFVRFNKREEAQEAISALNNVIPEGGAQPLSVRLAEEHGKAKAAHFLTQMGMGPPAPPHMHMSAQGLGGAGAGMAAYNNMVHRGENFADLLDGLYRKKSFHYPYL